MKLIKAIFIGLSAIFILPECEAVEVQVRDWHGLERELPTIRKAAQRNNCNGKLFTILLAIRKAENGREGLEFGVIHPRAINTNLDIQAGWAAATVTKNYRRWKHKGNTEGGIPDFIDFLADRYCPKTIDPVGNKNWKKNVLYWFRKFNEWN